MVRVSHFLQNNRDRSAVNIGLLHQYFGSIKVIRVDRIEKCLDLVDPGEFL